MSAVEAVTLVKNAVHNPNEPRHFMRIVPAGHRTASLNGHTVADSPNAVLVKEVGLDIYDPVVYFPRDGVDMSALVKIDKSTHCPLKGDTEYFDIEVNGQRVSETAWSYVDLIDCDQEEALSELKSLIAFDTSKVTVSA
ncbi:MAG: DUF427 domain-containing protein [Acidimicrobiales bacterium]|nr:DUF427 domain-containing protein [Acidimicrobiales bacterium]RZV42944.1 MAG: DUF427 domain-containing protein [Acidimicrobiales bacterium]